jgi:hypothetical protein
MSLLPVVDSLPVSWNPEQSLITGVTDTGDNLLQVTSYCWCKDTDDKHNVANISANFLNNLKWPQPTGYPGDRGELIHEKKSEVEHFALQRQFRLYIPFLRTARPQLQFLHSCVCERFICSQDGSTYFLQQNRQTDSGNI